jgi:hypothetical protein
MMLLDAVLVGGVVVASLTLLIVVGRGGGCHKGGCGGCPAATSCLKGRSKNDQVPARGVMRFFRSNRMIKPRNNP